jgi:hypothetical protein
LHCEIISFFTLHRFKNITKEFLLENLTQNPTTGQWGVALDTVGVTVFHDCYFDPFLPDTLLDRIRTCNSISVTRHFQQLHSSNHDANANV